MSAETLRKAADLMRERATKAEASGDGEPWFPADELHGLIGGGSRNTADAQHIASWHPAVALAVADLLHEQAIRWEENFAATQRPSRGVDEPPAINYGNPEAAALAADYHARFALAVARAYLGESA